MLLFGGIDPAYHGSDYGVGIVGFDGSRYHYVASGSFSTKVKDLTLTQRMSYIYQIVLDFMANYKLEAVAVEGQFVCKNAKTALQISCARGAGLAAIGRTVSKSYEIAPQEVKAIVGVSEKKEMPDRIRSLLSLTTLHPSLKLTPDSSDALALAIVASFKWSWEQKLEAANRKHANRGELHERA